MVHVVIVSYPAPGCLNPTVQLAKLLVQCGVEVTFGTTVRGQAYISASTTETAGISFATISDGLDIEPHVDFTEPHYPRRLERHGSVSLSQLIFSLAASGRHVHCVLFNFVVPWAAKISHAQGIPSALGWPQTVSMLSLYYQYIFTSAANLFEDLDSKESVSIQLPSLPPLAMEDLPSFFLPTNTYPDTIPLLREMFSYVLDKKCTWVFANSFDSLEQDVIDSLRETFNINVTAIGPLIPSLSPKTIKQCITHAETSGNLQQPEEKSRDQLADHKCELMEWLDAKPARSVVYISFGSVANVKSAQIDELATGLMEMEHPFVWVIRPPEDYHGFPSGFEEVVSERGTVVRWCAQVEVLKHPAVGGFVTHGGWNSTLEGLATGKPMVCVPQWSDQGVNAKLVSYLWRTGVGGRKNAEGLIQGEELRRCVGLLMDEESGIEMRENVAKVQELAKLAIGHGGSSNQNILDFVDALRRRAEKEESTMTLK